MAVAQTEEFNLLVFVKIAWHILASLKSTPHRRAAVSKRIFFCIELKSSSSSYVKGKPLKI